jgi:hypothetical protein
MAGLGAQFFFRTKLQNIAYWTMHQFLLQMSFTPFIKHFYVFKNQPYMTSASLSSLDSIEQLYLTQHPLLNQIHHVIHNLAVDNTSHSSGCQDIAIFKTADKAATNLQMPSDFKMNTCDLKSKIKKESLTTWQNQWEQTTSKNYKMMVSYQSVQPNSSGDHQNENRTHPPHS